jgi:phage regulator Rha-like protein
VRRNISRFPEDFMVELSEDEEVLLRSQFATLKGTGKHSKYLSFVFTEQGVAMLSSVLNSKRAIEVNIAIMRAFVKMRELLATNKEFAGKLKRIEEHLAEHNDQFRVVFKAIRQLLLIFMLGRFLLVAMEKGSSTPQGGIKKNLRLTLLG